MRMPRPSRTLRTVLVVLAAAPIVASLTGCVVVPAHRYRGYGDGYGVGAGYYGAPPYAGAIWIEGYWSNDRYGGRRWNEGHWGRGR